MKFSKQEIKILENILNRFSRMKEKSRKKFSLMDYNHFLSSLNKDEKVLIKRIQNLDLKKYNKITPFLGILPIPKNIVMVRGQKCKINNKLYNVPIHFLPRDVYRAFKRMNRVVKIDLKRPLNIISGYRSPAYQMYVLLYFLKVYNWNIRKTLKRVALPGYSEHGYPLRQGVDIGTFKPVKDIKDFIKTEEYKWLGKNASKFGFYLSFPRENKSGVMFEPWHWHYEQK